MGSTFEKYLIKAVDSIRDNPLKTQVMYDSTRVFFLKKFPFGVHFNVMGNNILIVAVFHTSRNPQEWVKRK